MNEKIIHIEEAGELSLTDDVMKAEFKMATWQAVKNNLIDFEFYGYVIDTTDAMDVVNDIAESRTYH